MLRSVGDVEAELDGDRGPSVPLAPMEQDEVERVFDAMVAEVGRDEVLMVLQL